MLTQPDIFRKIVFIVHRIGVTPPGVGGWQRSKMFYDAARRLGPIEIVLVDNIGDGPIERFEGATAKHVLPPDDFYLARGLRRQAVRVKRLLTNAEYAHDPALSDLVTRLTGDAPDTLVVIRYAKTYWRTGLWKRARADRPVLCVDVDDRDDQRLASSLPARIGAGATRAAAPVLAGFARLLRKRLARADLVCFAARKDVWTFPDPTSGIVIPNAPGHAPETVSDVPPSASRSLLFLGAHAHPANRSGLGWFLRTCWPEIVARIPDARLRIAGYGPWDAFCDGMGPLRNVEVVGAVADLGAEYARCRAALCPGFEASGSKVKLIEAFAFGRPVISTAAAARGYDVPDGAALRIADTPAAFVAACCDYLSDDALADRGGSEGRRLQQDAYSAAAITDRIEGELRALVRPGARPART